MSHNSGSSFMNSGNFTDTAWHVLIFCWKVFCSMTGVEGCMLSCWWRFVFFGFCWLMTHSWRIDEVNQVEWVDSFLNWPSGIGWHVLLLGHQLWWLVDEFITTTTTGGYIVYFIWLNTDCFYRLMIVKWSCLMYMR